MWGALRTGAQPCWRQFATNPRRITERLRLLLNRRRTDGNPSQSVFPIRISFYADPDPGSQKCPYGSESKDQRRKITPNKFSTNSSKWREKSLKIKKQNIDLSITKGSILLFFQFCIHLMNLYILKAFFPPGFAWTYTDPCGSGSETLLSIQNFVAFWADSQNRLGSETQCGSMSSYSN